jgi:hypothetical protein
MRAALRSAVAAVVAIVAAAATLPLAAVEPVVIETFGTRTLLVTAPAGPDPAVAAQLAVPISVDWRQTGIDTVAETLRAATGLNVVVDPATRRRAPVIDLQVERMSAADLIVFVERLAGIHVSAQRGALHLGEQPLAGTLRTVAYDVSDLLLPAQPFPGPRLTLAGGTEPAATAVPPAAGSVEELAALLRTLVVRD